MSTAANAIRPDRHSTQIDLDALKTRQRGAWSSGDYAIVGEDLCEALDIRSGEGCSM